MLLVRRWLPSQRSTADTLESTRRDMLLPSDPSYLSSMTDSALVVSEAHALRMSAFETLSLQAAAVIERECRMIVIVSAMKYKT